MGRNCYAHTHREDVPLEVHHVWPVGAGGPDIYTNRISLCANAHGSVHHYLARMTKAAPPDGLSTPPRLPWSVRRVYGRKVRRIAEAGWTAMSVREIVPL